MIVWIGRCEFPLSEEQRIFKIIKTAQKAIQKENLNKLSEIISRDYNDAWGHDAEGVLDFLNRTFLRYERIKIKLALNSIDITQYNYAICDLNVWVSCYDVYTEEICYWQERIFIYLTKSTGDWKILHTARYSLRTIEPAV
jgi:hypothetical protein